MTEPALDGDGHALRGYGDTLGRDGRALRRHCGSLRLGDVPLGMNGVALRRNRHALRRHGRTRRGLGSGHTDLDGSALPRRYLTGGILLYGAPLRGTFRHGPGRDGARRDGSRRDGPGRDGAGRHGTRRDGAGRHGTRRHGAGRHGTRRDKTRRRGARRTGRGRLRCGPLALLRRHGPPPTARRRTRGMRLRRGVIGGLVVGHGVVPPLLDHPVTGGSRLGDRHGPLPLGGHLTVTGHSTLRPRTTVTDLLHLLGLPRLNLRDGRSGRAGLRGRYGLIGLGRRQGEHRTRSRRLLRRRPLVRGSQRTPPTPCRLLSLPLSHIGRTAGFAGRRGQRRRQRALLTGFALRPTPGGLGYALRWDGTAQPRTRGGGPGRMLGGRDDGPLGDTLDGTPDGLRSGVLGRTPAPPPGTARHAALTGSLRRKSGRFPGGPPPAPPGSGTGITGLVALTRNIPVEEGIGGGPPRPAPPPSRGLLLRGSGHALDDRQGGGIRGDSPGPAPDRHLEDVRTPAHPRHFVRLQHAAVSPDDPPHDRLVHGVAAGVRPAHLDAYDLAALRRRHHDGVVQVTARRHGRVAGRVDPRDVRDEMREGGGEQPGVDLGLDGRRVHGELHPPGPDELDGPVDPGGDDGVQHHLRTGDALAARVEPLVAEDVVDERRDARIAGRQVVQHLVGLGPQLPGVVGGQGGQLAAQFLERPAQRPAEQGQQLLVPGGERLEPVLLPLPERGVPVLVRGEFLGVPLAQLLQLGDVLLAQRGQLGGVLLGDPLQLFRVPLLRGLLLLDDGVVRPPVGEGHHGADELVAVAHGRGRQVDRHLAAVLGVQHLSAHPVLAPGAQGVGERRLVVGEGRAVGARVQDESRAVHVRRDRWPGNPVSERRPD